MTEQRSTSGLDFETLRHAIEQRYPNLLAGLYADDAELTVVNRNTPPGAPFVLRGREAITEYYGDVCGREMTHRVENEVLGKHRAAFNQACEYPDGTRVLCASTLDLDDDGRITHQTNVEVWDE